MRQNQQTATAPSRDTRLTYLGQRLTEAFDELWDNFVDPADALYDLDGSRWTQLGGDGVSADATLGNELQLAEVRNQCRALAATNEFAINGHENRISYVVGTGHTYRVVARRDRDASQQTVRQVQAVLDEFLHANKWHQRQQEIVRRKDRDGECFLRLFAAGDGTTAVRFVEPDQIATPTGRSGDRAASQGVQTDPRDVETVIGYWIDGQLVDTGEIQHRKLGVDANVKRGLPLFYPVRKNLRRAEKLLRNMSVVAEIQSAIALIRKHVAATSAGVDQFVQNQADLSVTSQTTGRTSHFRRYGPGTILDAMAGTEYEFPTAGLDAAKFVVVLQAELRAIAARLVMPEFMLTSDASNANYSSTMVAEGPAVKMFERLQRDMIEDDREILLRVLAYAVDAGRLPPDAPADVDVQAVAPTLAVRNRLHDAKADEILVRNGAMNAATMAMRHGLEATEQG
ncbi:MAG: phage portal protein [Candidatus Nealsonbacteria bacterium]|nr:phage portal protein [Candidatus Nealsonbacteria bacterium]